MSRHYIVPSWNDAAADEYSGEQISGKRRRNGGNSRGLVWDKATDDVYPESDLYNANGSANVKLFSENDKLKAFLQDAFKAAKRKRIDIDELDRLDLTLERFRLLISDDDYEYLVNAFESLRRPSYLATLTPEKCKETEAEDLRDWLLSLSLEERRNKYPFLCQREGIPIADEKRQAFDVDAGKLVRKAVELFLLAIFIIYVFYIA